MLITAGYFTHGWLSVFCHCHLFLALPRGSGYKAFAPSLLAFQEVAAPVESGAAEETTLLTGPIQGDVVTINQKPLDLMLLRVGHSPSIAPLCCMQTRHVSVIFLAMLTVWLSCGQCGLCSAAD